MKYLIWVFLLIGCAKEQPHIVPFVTRNSPPALTKQVWIYSNDNFPIPKGGLVWIGADSMRELSVSGTRMYVDHDSLHGQWFLVHIFDREDIIIKIDP